MLELNSRKRFRITVVCNVCKGRKVKCDKKKPCNSCIKFKTTELCNYDDPLWIKASLKESKGTKDSKDVESDLESLKQKVSLLESIIRNQKRQSRAVERWDSIVKYPKSKKFLNLSSMIGINPVATEDDTLNFYENYGTLKVNSNDPMKRVDLGPFSWHALVRRDPCLFDLWCFLTHKRELLIEKDKLNIQHRNPHGVLMAIKRYLELLFGNTTYVNSFIPLGNNNEAPWKELHELIILPLNNIIWYYIDIFFKNLYPYLPFIDETNFRNSVSNIISNRTNGCGCIEITGIADCAILGLLLIVMRMGYLSLLSNEKDMNEHPIGAEYIFWAKKCLNQIDMLQNIDLGVIQFALYLWLYFRIAPENGEGPDRNLLQIFSGMIVQMAFSIGLNREPDNFNEVSTNERINHLRRKVWHQIKDLDIRLSIEFGSPLLITKRFYDTKLPFYTPGCENSLTPGLEREIIEIDESVNEILEKTKNILLTVLEITAKVKMVTISKYLCDMETITNKTFGNLHDYINACNDGKNWTWLIHAPLFISLRLFHASLYYVFFLHYERVKDIDHLFFYLKKSLCIGIEEFLPYFFDLLSILNEDTGYASQFMLNPSLEKVINRTNGFYFSTIFRIKYTLHKMTVEEMNSKPEYVNSLKKLAKLVSACSKITIVAISKLSDRYWYAWRIGKSHSFMLKTLISDSYYEDLDQFKVQKELPILQFKLDQILELIELFEKSLSKYRKEGFRDQWRTFSDVTKLVSEKNPLSLLEYNFDRDLEDFWSCYTEQMGSISSLPLGTNNIQHLFTDTNEGDVENRMKDVRNTLETYLELDAPYFDYGCGISSSYNFS